MAVAAFAIALLGIPLFGLVTGLIAVVVGGLALIGKQSFRRRGLALAVVGIVLGIFDFVGWAVFLRYNADQIPVAVALDEFEPDPDSLKDLPDPIKRAMKANVLVQTGALLRQGIGSGVILTIQDGSALIVTNRHVVDPEYAGSGGSSLDEISGLMVKMVGQPAIIAQAVWLAPNDVDLALISAPVVSEEPVTAVWDAAAGVKIGDVVFAVGNPHGLGWSHTGGDVSQIRRQTHGEFRYRVIQTSAAINPGNSGGGLYDSQGNLIGINTWTQDKRFAEGLGFAIVFQTLLELVPDRFQIPEEQTSESVSE